MDDIARRFQEDPISRHEAGEGWAPHGLDEAVLSGIALREALRLRNLAATNDTREGIKADLALVTQGVEQLKYEHNLPVPPSP